ncbi:hypothetical protein [Flavobacterium sp.]|uniref:hypothetical protein n=1 Tax=Flavobacterium sp. TaxID=239 RepID=UPI002ED9E806
MEIVNSQIIKKFVAILCISSGLISLITIMAYFCNFDGEISKSQAIWGAFGDYIGGVLGTFFNLLAVVFSIISIYITLKIAVKIHEIEDRNIRENIQRDNERFTQEKELIKRQNMPFPHFDYDRLYNNLNIILSNQGPGPLIIKNWEIIFDNVSFTNFGKLIDQKLTDKDYISLSYERLSKHVISSGSSTSLLKINDGQTLSPKQKKYLNDCNDLLTKCRIKISYEDIFENQYEAEEDLSH